MEKVGLLFFDTFKRLKVTQNQKADWRAVDSPKKQKDEFDLFAMKSKKANKTNSSVYFLGEVSRPCPNVSTNPLQHGDFGNVYILAEQH